MTKDIIISKTSYNDHTDMHAKFQLLSVPPVTVRPRTDLFTWTKTGNTPLIFLNTRHPAVPAIQPKKHARFAPQAFTKDAAHFILCALLLAILQHRMLLQTIVRCLTSLKMRVTG